MVQGNQVWLVMDTSNQVYDLYDNPEAAYKHARGTDLRVIKTIVKHVHQDETVEALA